MPPCCLRVLACARLAESQPNFRATSTEARSTPTTAACYTETPNQSAQRGRYTHEKKREQTYLRQGEEINNGDHLDTDWLKMWDTSLRCNRESTPLVLRCRSAHLLLVLSFLPLWMTRIASATPQAEKKGVRDSTVESAGIFTACGRHVVHAM